MFRVRLQGIQNLMNEWHDLKKAWLRLIGAIKWRIEGKVKRTNRAIKRAFKSAINPFDGLEDCLLTPDDWLGRLFGPTSPLRGEVFIGGQKIVFAPNVEFTREIERYAWEGSSFDNEPPKQCDWEPDLYRASLSDYNKERKFDSSDGAKTFPVGELIGVKLDSLRASLLDREQDKPQILARAFTRPPGTLEFTIKSVDKEK